MLEIILDGIKSGEYGFCIHSRPFIPSPQKRVKEYVVEGRHGALTKVDAYENINLSIKFNLLESDNIKPTIRLIKGYFENKNKLVFSDDLEFYYIIKLAQVGDIENEFEEYGYFEVNFILDPFIYQKEDNIIISQSQTIENQGTVESYPLIKIIGSGDGSISINGREIDIVGQVDNINIDSYLGIAYNDLGQSRSKYIRGAIPYLDIGSNSISFTGGVTKVEIDKRARFI